MKKINKTPLAAAMGMAFISTFSATAANAEANPFSVTEMSSGYMQLAEAGEMKCGASMGGMAKPKAAEGACAGSKAAAKKVEGSCGEGKCGNMMKDGKMKPGMEKVCGAMMKGKEGACGDKMKGCGEGMQGCTEMMKGKDGSCGAKMKATEAAAPAAAPVEAAPAK